MKRHFLLVAIFALFSLIPSIRQLDAQPTQRVQKLEQLAEQLQLTPQQTIQLMPILKAEAPEIQTIKSDPSLSRIQKLERLKAVHDRTDPQVRAILTPQQYQRLQEIRRTEIQQAIRQNR
jgi:hypothetical protein